MYMLRNNDITPCAKNGASRRNIESMVSIVKKAEEYAHGISSDILPRRQSDAAITKGME